MKWLFSIVVVLIYFSTYSQIDTTFNNIYSPHHGTTTIRSLIVIPDNNFYYASFGQIDTHDFKQNYGFLKFSKEGNIVDTAFYGVGDKLIGTDANYGHGFIRTTDSSFLYCGGAKDTSGRVLGFLVKTNSDFDTLWTKLFQHPDTLFSIQNNTSISKLMDIRETPDGGYILAGEYNYHCTGNTNRGLLYKTDILGNIEWFKTYGARIRDLEIDPVDSGYYFPSWNNYVNTLTKTNKYGNVLWTRNFNTNLPYPYKPVGPFDIEIVDSNNLVVGSSSFIQTTPNTGYNKHIVATKINTTDKSIVWEKRFSPYDRFMNITLLQSINIDKYLDDRIVISGTSWVTDSLLHWNSQRGIILSINNNGDSLWSRYYSHLYSDGDDEDTQLNDLAVCDDGGFLLGGFYDIHSYIYTDCWLVKTDSMGYAPAAFTVGIENEELIISKPKLLIYPNPTSNNINLSMQENPKEELQLEIYNISGQLVIEKRLPAFEKEHRINIQHLQSGVYLVKLVSDSQVVYSSKIVKE